MKKNVLIKGILVLVVLAFLTVGFTGCSGGSVYPVYSTGTVYVWTDSYDNYDIYMDNVWKTYSYYSSSYVVIYNVPVGYHTFSASGYWWYGSKTQYIYSGTNYVDIYTY